jgi:hypothetical protein
MSVSSLLELSDKLAPDRSGGLRRKPEDYSAFVTNECGRGGL